MKGAWRRLVNYVRHDLREIVAPSSLPDPPGVKPERRLTLQEWRQLWNETWRDYKASWKSAPCEAPASTPEAGQAGDGVSGAQLREDIGVISRGGAAQLRPILQRMYAERLAALQDAGRAFVDGYRGGLEKAKQDTLLEDLADKLWRQTAPDKGQGHGTAESASSLQQPLQHTASAAGGGAAPQHVAPLQAAARSSQAATSMDTTPAAETESGALEQQQASPLTSGRATDYPRGDPDQHAQPLQQFSQQEHIQQQQQHSIQQGSAATHLQDGKSEAGGRRLR